MKKLFIDIETSPNTAYVWGLFKETIPLARLIESSEILCYSAKWYKEDKVFFDSIFYNDTTSMLEGIHRLLDDADEVVHYNGRAFDIPCLNKEFLLNGIDPPAPYKQTDLLLVARNKFRFTSNKLDYVAQQLGLGKKHETDFKLWVDCMNKDPVAWKKMEEYNKNDVILLEKVYEKFAAWIGSSANYGLYENSTILCPTCGSTSYQRRGFAYTKSRKYRRYHCKSCGSWFRDTKCESGTTANFTAL